MEEREPECGRIAVRGGACELCFEVSRPAASAGARGSGGGGGLTLLLHGGPGLPSVYMRPLLTTIAGDIVASYDQAGCGRSGPVESNSLEECAGDAVELVEHLRALYFSDTPAPPINLVGHSWGGFVAAAVARELSRRLTGAPLKVVLLGTGAVLREVSDQGRRLLEFIRRGEEMRIFRERLAEREKHRDCDGHWEAPALSPFEESMQTASSIYFERHECRLKPVPECLSAALESFHASDDPFRGAKAVEDVDIGDLAPLRRVPILLIRGESDFCERRHMEPLAAACASATILEVPEAGHYAFLERPAEVAAAVNGFLATRGGAPGRGPSGAAEAPAAGGDPSP